MPCCRRQPLHSQYDKNLKYCLQYHNFTDFMSLIAKHISANIRRMLAFEWVVMYLQSLLLFSFGFSLWESLKFNCTCSSYFLFFFGNEQYFIFLITSASDFFLWPCTIRFHFCRGTNDPGSQYAYKSTGTHSVSHSLTHLMTCCLIHLFTAIFSHSLS